MEAMASGVPVVTTRLSGIPELVEGAGLLVDPMDTAALFAGSRTRDRRRQSPRTLIPRRRARRGRIRSRHAIDAGRRPVGITPSTLRWRTRPRAAWPSCRREAGGARRNEERLVIGVDRAEPILVALGAPEEVEHSYAVCSREPNRLVHENAPEAVRGIVRVPTGLIRGERVLPPEPERALPRSSPPPRATTAAGPRLGGRGREAVERSSGARWRSSSDDWAPAVERRPKCSLSNASTCSAATRPASTHSNVTPGQPVPARSAGADAGSSPKG